MPLANPPVRDFFAHPIATIVVVGVAILALMLIDALVAAWSPSRRGLFERARDLVARVAPAPAAPVAS